MLLYPSDIELLITEMGCCGGTPVYLQEAAVTALCRSSVCYAPVSVVAGQ